MPRGGKEYHAWSSLRPDAARPDPAVEELAAGFTVVPAGLEILLDDAELGAMPPEPVLVDGDPFAAIALAL